MIPCDAMRDAISRTDHVEPSRSTDPQAQTGDGRRAVCHRNRVGARQDVTMTPRVASLRCRCTRCSFCFDRPPVAGASARATARNWRRARSGTEASVSATVGRSDRRPRRVRRQDPLERPREVVPPRGFEPLISTLKGWRPRPLDDGGTLARRWPSLAEGPSTASSEERCLRALRAARHLEQDDRPGCESGRGHRRSAADEGHE